MFDPRTAEQLSLDLKTGYWKVNNKCFFSKVECLRYATQIRNENVTFHFCDSLFKTINWRIEPTESLSQIYKNRAQQLRDKYKYVALAFSGGVDSSNILDTFLNNNIKLDEVVSYYPLQMIEQRRHLFNIADKNPANIMFEYLTAAKPRLEWLAKNHPDIKITILDPTVPARDIILNGTLFESTMGGVMMSANLIGQSMMRDHVSRHNQSCTIQGLDKPVLLYNSITKLYNACFYDFSFIHGNWDNKSTKDYTTEYFYITPDMPEVTIKQSHELKKAFDIEFSRLNTLADCKNIKPTTNKLPLYKIHSRVNFSNSVLYPQWDNSIYQVRKPRSRFYAPGNSPYIAEPKKYDFYTGQLKEFIHGVSERFIDRADNNEPEKFKDYWTSPNWF
jgi:hypothetical protein